MRGWLIVALACVSCGRKTALHPSGADARPDVTTSADTRDAVSPDARLVADAPPDRASTPDVALAADLAPSCSPLSASSLSQPSPYLCPPSSEPAACAGGDIGVVVARSADCVAAWGAVPVECVMGPEPRPAEEIVLIEVGDCLAGVSIQSVVACADHIELKYVVNLYCESCDRHGWWTFSLPRDDRPVIASGETNIPPCRQPPFYGTGGATGTGGHGSPLGTGGAGGGTAVDGGCPTSRIDVTQAAAAYAAYAGLAPSIRVVAEEETVPGLWEEMHAQLFSARRYADGGSTSPTPLSFLYRECMLVAVGDESGWDGPLASGAVANGAFYYSWGWGSGVYRTEFGKVAWGGTTVTKLASGGYTNGGYGPPPLVIALEAGEMRVYRPSSTPSDLNQWQGGELFATLADLGDRLVLVDGNGQEITPFSK